MWTSRGFISPTARMCFGICGACRPGRDLAEEITQETFVKALKAIDRFQGDKDIRAWLFTIAKHTYYTHCKREKRTTGGGISPVHPRTGGNLWWSRSSTGERAFQVHRFLHGMREPYKEVFTLRVFGELPFEKIGLLFGENTQLGPGDLLPGEETNHRIYGGD